MSDPTLILRRAQARKRGERQDEDYDVFDGDRDVGRIYLVHSDDGTETWFWGVSFQVTKRKSYGYAMSLEEAEASGRNILPGREPKSIAPVESADGDAQAPPSPSFPSKAPL